MAEMRGMIEHHLEAIRMSPTERGKTMISAGRPIFGGIRAGIVGRRADEFS